jgi:hypothetical protein
MQPGATRIAPVQNEPNRSLESEMPENARECPIRRNRSDERSKMFLNVPKCSITAKMQNEPICARASRNALQNPALRAT